jgi:hypothetical protein
MGNDLKPQDSLSKAEFETLKKQRRTSKVSPLLFDSKLREAERANSNGEGEQLNQFVLNESKTPKGNLTSRKVFQPVKDSGCKKIPELLEEEAEYVHNPEFSDGFRADSPG